MASGDPEDDMTDRIERACADPDLRTVFQPMIELDTKDCIAYEALTRFSDDDDSLTTRDWFAAAESLGIGAKLELAEVAAALRHLEDIPATAALAINVSPKVAVTDEFFELVAPYASRLILELTEHEPVDDYDALVDGLQDLRDLGARIAIDDVGAGFASMRHILRLAPEIVKLDLSLTADVTHSAGSRVLTSVLVDFAERTGVLITAEGIETLAELEVLRELGIDHGQGFLLGPPRALEAHLN